MSRYLPSATYLHLAVIAFLLSATSGYISLQFLAALVPAVLLFLTGLVLLLLYWRPAIEIYPTHLAIGEERYAWSQIREVDHSGWLAPLVVRLGFQDKSRMVLVYPGDLETATMLLRELRQNSQTALLDGIPYREFWRLEAVPPTMDLPKKSVASAAKPKYPLLSPGEEEEIERLYQRLKTVGHLDTRDDQ